MEVSAPRAFRTTALLGLLGVALGAFGAHALKPLFLARPAAGVWWEKAVFYHLIHTGVMLLAACRRPFPAVAWSLLGSGVLLFSGSLYVMAFTGWLKLGIVTPLGGLCLLAGWLALAGGRLTTS